MTKCGEQGKNQALGEMQQLHECGCMEPTDPFLIEKWEKRNAFESFTFMVKKTDN